MPQSVNKGYEVQTTGSNSGTWGEVLNDDVITIIDKNLGGIVTKSLSNSNISLSTSEAQNAIVRLTGTLTDNVQVTNASKGLYVVENATAGAFAVTLTNGTAATSIPQGTRALVIADATNGCRMADGIPPGAMMDYAGTVAPAGWLLCYGQAISRTTYAALFAALSTTYGAGDGSTTFNLPDCRGRVSAGLDNMGGVSADRLTGLSGGVDGDTLGNTGGSQSHELSESEIPSHTHDVTDPGHSHDYTRYSGLVTVGSEGVINLIWRQVSTQQTSSEATGITIDAAGGGGSHNNVQPTIVLNKIIRTGL